MKNTSITTYISLACIATFVGINITYGADIEQPMFAGKVTYELWDDLLRKGL